MHNGKLSKGQRNDLQKQKKDRPRRMEVTAVAAQVSVLGPDLWNRSQVTFTVDNSDDIAIAIVQLNIESL